MHIHALGKVPATVQESKIQIIIITVGQPKIRFFSSMNLGIIVAGLVISLALCWKGDVLAEITHGSNHFSIFAKQRSKSKASSDPTSK